VKQDDGVILTTKDITSYKNAVREVLRLKEELAEQVTEKYLTLFNSSEQSFCIN